MRTQRQLWLQKCRGMVANWEIAEDLAFNRSARLLQVHFSLSLSLKKLSPHSMSSGGGGGGGQNTTIEALLYGLVITKLLLSTQF